MKQYLLFFFALLIWVSSVFYMDTIIYTEQYVAQAQFVNEITFCVFLLVLGIGILNKENQIHSNFVDKHIAAFCIYFMYQSIILSVVAGLLIMFTDLQPMSHWWSYLYILALNLFWTTFDWYFDGFKLK